MTGGALEISGCLSLEFMTSAWTSSIVVPDSENVDATIAVEEIVVVIESVDAILEVMLP